ncbi:hypothetical protein [Buttiauxella warmboldiae]|nr:hypothetical protein [Buttiauxella warmboldiae]
MNKKQRYKHIYSLSSVSIMTILLAACTQYKWVKPGESDSSMRKEYVSCQAKSLRELPPDNMVHSDSVYGSADEKDKKKKRINYEQSTNYDISDANENAREVLITDCMMARGWTQIIIN